MAHRVDPTDVQQPPVLPAPIQPGLPPDALAIDSMDLDAQGVARRADGKVVFVEGALPTEWVSAHTVRRKKAWEQATLTTIHRESALRVQPRCPHFGLHPGACGGCKMQHLDPLAQVAMKQRALEDQLWHLGKVQPDQLLRPIAGPAWGYRYRGRLSVRYVAKKGDVLVGFHERQSRYVADMHECHVLPKHISDWLMPLRALFLSMDARETCPQLELACGDPVSALVLRHLEPLTEADLARLRAFAQAHSTPLRTLQWWLQPKGPDTVHPLDAIAPSAELAYDLPEFGLRMPFRPTDFTQVNPYINQVLVSRALTLLAVQPHERVIDWFCGLGNFTLPLATQGAHVRGIEGSETLVARSRANLEGNQARRHAAGLPALAPTTFVARNLFQMTPEMLVADGTADKWLIDPPREGAAALVGALVGAMAERHLTPQRGEAATGPVTGPEWQPPQRIVYVSCNPATLARDAGILVHQAGYQCRMAGVINMFPHTAHVESMAVFEK